MQLNIDPNEFTLGELEEFEELTGLGIESLGPAMPTKALTALVYLVERRTDPEFTMEAARKLKVGDIEGPNPTTPAGS
jgi:hypothetical protein